MFAQGLVSVITLAALCGAAVVPVEKSVIQLTAPDADTGNWTANMGEMEINIEHEHNGRSNTNGTWTITMARTFYDKEEEDVKQNNSQEKTNESPQSMQTTSMSTPEIEDNKLPEEEEQEIHILVDNVSEEMSNTIPTQKTTTKKNYNEYDDYFADYINFHPQQADDDYFGQNSDDNSDSEEFVSDPDNFEYFKGVGWFKLDSREKSWENAREACLAVGAHLAVPDTKERIRVFLKLFQRHPEIPRNAVLTDQVYIGVNDPLENRVFTTVQDHVFKPDFPIWFPNEPDNAFPGEECVTFHTQGKIRDVPCFYRLPFFCEKDLPVLI